MIEAMKQALEALENTYALRDDVIAAKESLRQAIARAEGTLEAEKHEVSQESACEVGIKLDASAPLVMIPHPAFQKRTWVGLTYEEIDYQAKKADHGVYFALGALWAEAKLKEKNT